MTALAGNVTAQALDDGPQTYVVRATPTARPLPGPEEWAWPGGEAGGELPLSPAFVVRLERAARKAHVEPSLVRAAIRAKRGGGSPNLTRIAKRLRGKDEWLALVALEGRTGYADRALALTRYYRASGDGPPAGVELTSDAGRQLRSGLVDPRLVALAGYLGQALGGVRVTSVAEPRLELAAPLAEAHAQGRAIAIDVDGEDAKGTRLAHAIRALLALPAGAPAHDAGLDAPPRPPGRAAPGVLDPARAEHAEEEPEPEHAREDEADHGEEVDAEDLGPSGHEGAEDARPEQSAGDDHREDQTVEDEVDPLHELVEPLVHEPHLELPVPELLEDVVHLERELAADRRQVDRITGRALTPAGAA